LMLLKVPLQLREVHSSTFEVSTSDARFLDGLVSEESTLLNRAPVWRLSSPFVPLSLCSINCALPAACVRVASRLSPVAYPLCLVLYGVLFVFSDVVDPPLGVIIVTPIPLLGIILYELPRCQRLLFVQLFRTFEFYYLLLQLVVYVVATAVIEVERGRGVLIACRSVPSFCLTFLLLVLEAQTEWRFRWRLRALILFLFASNVARVFLQQAFGLAQLPSVSFCLWQCSDTRHLALTSLFQLGLFFCRYFVLAIRRPNDFALLSISVSHRIDTGLDVRDRLSVSAA
jgi:hypothetical protein